MRQARVRSRAFQAKKNGISRQEEEVAWASLATEEPSCPLVALSRFRGLLVVV